jgi:hypothetical protein
MKYRVGSNWKNSILRIKFEDVIISEEKHNQKPKPKHEEKDTKTKHDFYVRPECFRAKKHVNVHSWNAK